jgi:hypothetical protein
VIFDDVVPVAGETQIRTEGLYVSSYAKDEDGLPFLSSSAASILRQPLRDKQRFESSPPCWERKTSWNETNEPMEVILSFDGGEVRLTFEDVLLPWALEHDPEAAAIILAVQAKAATWEPPQPPSQPATIPPQSDRSCAVCDRTFLAKRADARYCSPKCRKRAARYPGALPVVTDNLPVSSL